MRHASRGLTAFAAILLLVMSAVAQQRNSDIENIGNRDINRGDVQFMVPNVEAEIAIGRNLARELEQNVTLLNNPVVVDYVNRVAQNVVTNSDAKLPFTIKVIDSAEVNAIGLPGGFLYVTAGLIQTADNEAQLAAMIAHAVAHVAARHAAEQQGRATLVNMAALPLTASPSVPSMGFPDLQKGSPALPLSFLKWDRAAVEEADWLGLQYLYKAGYDPTAMVVFFQKVTTLGIVGRPVSESFSTHPRIEDRIAQSLKNIRTYLPARQQNVVTTAEFQEIKNRLLELKAK